MPQAVFTDEQGVTHPSVSFMTPHKIQRLDKWLSEAAQRIKPLQDVIDLKGKPVGTWEQREEYINQERIEVFWVCRVSGLFCDLRIYRNRGGLGRS